MRALYPVSLAHHLAHLQPLQDGTQALLSHALLVEPAPAQQLDSVDSFGNAQRHFSLAQPHDELTVRSASRVATFVDPHRNVVYAELGVGDGS